MQTVAAPDELLWVSGVLPGRTVDITAARRFKIADKVLQFLGLLADLGYVGLHPEAIIGYKRRRGEKTRRIAQVPGQLLLQRGLQDLLGQPSTAHRGCRPQVSIIAR